MVDEHIERPKTLILPKIVRQWNEEKKADNAAVWVAIFSGCIETKMVKFPTLLWRKLWQKCGSRFRRRISVEFNSLN